MRLCFFMFFLSSLAGAYPITSLKVTGQKEAEVRFSAPSAPAEMPSPQVKGTQLELFLPGAELDASFEGKVNLNAPHALVKVLSVTQEKKGVMIRADLQGKSGDWKDKVAFIRDGQASVLRLGAPVATTPALEYAKAEQLPVLAAEAPAVKPAGTAFGVSQWLLILGILVVAAISTFAVVKVLRLKGKTTGSRKYLIEQLAHCSLGPKTGVSLVRVGREFVLVGVTPHQVNLLSHVPALQAQYETETQFERESFKDAVDEEIARLKKEIAL